MASAQAGRPSRGKGPVSTKSLPVKRLATRSWDFPLSRAEKMQRVLLLFENEVERGERENSGLRQENLQLRTAVQSLAGVAPMKPEPQEAPRQSRRQSDKRRASKDGNTNISQPQLGESSSEALPSTEAQRMASFIDHTAMSVVEETVTLLDQTSKKVVEDTWQAAERSATAVDAALSDSASFIDQTSRSMVEETFSLIDQTSNKVAEDTRQTTEALKRFQEQSATAMDAALTESAKTIELKRNDFIQAIGEFRKDSAGRATLFQAQAQELGGSVQEQAHALGASLFHWGQAASSEQAAHRSEPRINALAPLGDEIAETALELREKAQEALGGMLGGWFGEPISKPKKAGGETFSQESKNGYSSLVESSSYESMVPTKPKVEQMQVINLMD